MKVQIIFSHECGWPGERCSAWQEMEVFDVETTKDGGAYIMPDARCAYTDTNHQLKLLQIIRKSS